MLLISKFSLNWLVAAFPLLALAATALSIHLERKFEKEISRISKILIFWKWVTQFTKWIFAWNYFIKTFPIFQTISYSLQTDKLDLTQQNYNCIIPNLLFGNEDKSGVAKRHSFGSGLRQTATGFWWAGGGRPGQKFCWHDQAWAFHQCQVQQQLLQTPTYIVSTLLTQ